MSVDLDLPTDVQVTEIYRGQMRHGTVRTRLPRPTDSMFLAAPLLPHHDATLDAVAEVATRCAPWLRVYAGPRLWSPEDGRDLSAMPERTTLPDGRRVVRLGGQAWSHDVILVSMCHGLSQVISILHHELWHAVESRLSVESMAIVDAATASGRDYPGTYLPSATERRARLYEHWSSAVDEGKPVVTVGGQIANPVDRVFWHVHSGGLAAEVAAQETAAAKPRPSLLRRVAAAL